MKVRKTLKDNKKSLIIIGILWIVLAIILVSPIAYSIVESINNGIFDFSKFMLNMLTWSKSSVLFLVLWFIFILFKIDSFLLVGEPSKEENKFCGVG